MVARFDLMAQARKLWLYSPERMGAHAAFLENNGSIGTISNNDPDDIVIKKTGALFRHSQEYRDAILAFRRRVNGAPDAETT